MTSRKGLNRKTRLSPSGKENRLASILRKLMLQAPNLFLLTFATSTSGPENSTPIISLKLDLVAA